MKSVLNKIEKEKSKEVVFPVLAEALVGGETFVVLLVDDDRGVVVKGNKYNAVGEVNTGYKFSQNPSNWRILSPEESIMLSNDWYFSYQIFFDYKT